MKHPASFALPNAASAAECARRALAVIVAAVLLAACDGADEDVVFKSRNAHYHFPPDTVVSMTTSPHRLIRVAPPGEPFELVFDSRIDDQVDRRGHPKIFSINDGLLFAKTYKPTAAGVIACRPGVSTMDCGMALSVSGEHWSMLFPPAHNSQAVAMAERAVAYIEAHRLDADESRPER